MFFDKMVEEALPPNITTMKKLLILLGLILITSNCFAYYGSYSSSSEDSEWLVFLLVLMIIGGILEIVLFFKIWGMTDNVKLVKDFLIKENVLTLNDKETASKIRKYYVMDDKEQCKRILLSRFMDIIESYDHYVKNKDGSFTWVKGVGANESIQPYIDSLKKQFDKIGEKVPSFILNMKTVEDFYNLFSKSDLKIVSENKSH